MTAETQLTLYNTLTRQKEQFHPIDEKNVRMYVCGPTVYDFAHIGNARPVIVFDVLFRLLRHLFGEDHVTYVRNITDVDDKINTRALRDFGDRIASGKMSLNEAIREVTEKTANQFHADVKALGCLEPTIEPRATEYVLPRDDGRADMVTLIQQLLDRQNAYIATGKEGREVLFDVTSMENYGALSNRKLEDQQAGARIEAKDHKKNPGDFVLWKESAADQPGWDGTFDVAGESVTIHGRPGWHIECSAMSAAWLGETFDIHGGGLDLIFPHHENEIAQSCCAHGTDRMANIWMHNGYLQVEGKKMSKSDGNFVTIHDLLHTEKFGGTAWFGGTLRFAMLMTHYREPIDFSVKRLEEANRKLREHALNISHVLEDNELLLGYDLVDGFEERLPLPSENVLNALCDDLNFSNCVAHFSDLRIDIAGGQLTSAMQLYADLSFLGFFDVVSFRKLVFGLDVTLDVTEKYRDILNQVRALSLNGNLRAALKKVAELNRQGVMAEEIFPGGWKFRISELDEKSIKDIVTQRLAFIADKNWAEADRIRDELLSQGIQLKDSKDSETGERITTWEVKR